MQLWDNSIARGVIIIINSLGMIMGQDSTFFRGILGQGGVFTLYTGFAGLPSFSKIIPVRKTLTHWSKPQKENSVYSEQREWRADDNFHPLIQTTKGE